MKIQADRDGIGDPDAANHLAEEILFEGDRFDLLEGHAQLSLTSGANIMLSSPASLTITDAGHVRLNQGLLTAKIPKWATGFVVDTEAMRVVDLGTTFTVSAESPDVSEAKVLEGVVTVRPQRSGGDTKGSVVLEVGDAFRVQGERTERNRALNADPADATSLKKLDQLRPYKPVPIPGTGQGLQVGDEDPCWKVVSAPENYSAETPRYAVVCEAGSRYACNEPERSQWISLDRYCSRVPANGVYTFRTCFDLTGYDHNTVRLQCQILADNGVKAIRLNGVPVVFEPWMDNAQHQRFDRAEFRAVEIDEGLIPGVNQFDIDVWNGGETNRMQTFLIPNPTALRVEWHAFGYSASD